MLDHEMTINIHVHVWWRGKHLILLSVTNVTNEEKKLYWEKYTRKKYECAKIKSCWN